MTLYLNEPDHSGHAGGPDSVEVGEHFNSQLRPNVPVHELYIDSNTTVPGAYS